MTDHLFTPSRRDELRAAWRSRWPPEAVAAIVNASIVMLSPVLLLAVSWMATDVSGATATARVSPLYVLALQYFFLAMIVITPIAGLALIAAWRTWVHAKRYCEHRGTGWLGVIEGGGLGLLLAMMVLWPATMRSPLEAPPYLIFYGGAAALIGLAFGLVLRTSAVLVLRWRSSS